MNSEMVVVAVGPSLILSPPNPKSPWKRRENTQKNKNKVQGKSQNEKSEESEESKDWRVRVRWVKTRVLKTDTCVSKREF